MSVQPSPNGRNGKRESNGRFAKGNPGGPGNPFLRQVNQIRSMILEAVSEDDLREVVNALVARAKDGDVAAAREVFNRLVGRPADSIGPERLELERQKIDLQERSVDVAEDRLLQ